MNDTLDIGAKPPIFFADVPEDHAIAKALPGFEAGIPLPFMIMEQSKDKKPELKLEMIFGGFMYVFAYDRENAHFQYYKDIFLKLEPEILAELTQEAILKSQDYEFKEAESLFLALEGLFPDNNITRLNLAIFYENRADFYRQSDLIEDARIYEKKADEYYSEVILFDPPLPAGFFNAGFFYVKQKNYVKARSLFNTYIKIETEKSEDAKMRKEQAQAIIDSISQQKLDHTAYMDALSFINADEPEKALDRIRDFLGEHPKAWSGWFLLGWALRKLERWSDAKDAFNQCLKLGKDSLEIKEAYSDICNELAICFTELGDLDEAKRWLMSALENDIENIKIISNIATIEFKQGNLEESAAFFRTVLAINPDDAPAQEMLKVIDEKLKS